MATPETEPLELLLGHGSLDTSEKFSLGPNMGINRTHRTETEKTEENIKKTRIVESLKAESDMLFSMLAKFWILLTTL